MPSCIRTILCSLAPKSLLEIASLILFSLACNLLLRNSPHPFNHFSSLSPPTCVTPVKPVCIKCLSPQLHCGYCFLSWEVCTLVILFTSLSSLSCFSFFWMGVSFIHYGQKNLRLPANRFHNEHDIYLKNLTFLVDFCSSSWRATLVWSPVCHRRGHLQAVIKLLNWVTWLA